MEKGLGDATTSPWLNDRRVGVRLHLEEFRNGASYVLTKDQYNAFIRNKSVLGREDNSLYIARKDFVDKIFHEAKGNIEIIEKRLGFSKGWFSQGGGLVRVDIKNPLLHNIRMPSGLEKGANEFFRPGGYTSGGVPEAVIDNVPNTGENRSITFIK
jgi:hypothetical protein